MGIFANKRKTILFLRWLLIIALSYLLLFQGEELTWSWKVNALILLYISTNLLLLLMPVRFFEHPWFDLGLIIGDSIILYTAMMQTQFSSTYLMFFYFLIILLTTLGKGLRGIIVNGLLLIGVYVLFLVQDKGVGVLNEPGLLLQIPFLFISVIFYGVLVDQEQRRHNRILEEIQGVSEVISSTLNLREVYRTILDALVNLLGAQKCSIMLLDKSGTILTIQDARGISQEIIQSTRQPVGEGIAGWIVQQGRPLLLKDQAIVTPDGKQRDPLVGIVSAIAVPLKIKDRIIGVLNVASRSNKRRFTKQDLDLLTLFASEVATAIENARLFEELQGKGEQLKAVHMEVIMAFAGALESKDVYTGGHAQRLAVYSEAVALQLGLNTQEVELVKYAAILHDVGKISIPDRILHSTTGLSQEEWAIMQTHSEKGALMLSQIPSLSHLSHYIRHHHERWDGKGYPDRIKGEEIHLFSRIIAVSDTYDALTTTRPYQKGVSAEEAMGILKSCMGYQLDPRLVEVFLEVLTQNNRLMQLAVLKQNLPVREGLALPSLHTR